MAEDRYTEFGVIYRLVDLTAKSDASISVTNYKYSSGSEVFDNLLSPNYMTMEHNFSVLDGTKDEFPVTPTTYGLFTTAKSNSSKTFTNKSVITITFTDYHSLSGLTLNFEDAYPDSVNVKYYKDNSVVGNVNATVNSNRFVVETNADNYNKIVITFNTTHIPDRYIKLTSIIFGREFDWDETIIRSATLTQNISRISDMLSIDTLSFDIIDLNNEFNFGNSKGFHKYIQSKQELLPYEIVNDTKIPLGKFYLDKFSYELNLGKMTAVSFLGIMEKIPFKMGDWYGSADVPPWRTTVAQVLYDIFVRTCGYANYEVDSELGEQLVHMLMPPTDCRSALQQLLFVCGGIVDTTDSQNKIKITKPSNVQSSNFNITRNTKISTKVTKNAYVTGVTIQYLTGDGFSQKEIISGDFEAGTHEVILNVPTALNPFSPEPLEVTTGTDVTLGDCYPYVITFTTPTKQKIGITGTETRFVQKSYTLKRDFVDPGEMENIITYSTNMTDLEDVKELAKRLLRYNTGLPLEIEIQHIASDINMNDLRAVQNSVEGLDNYLSVFKERTFDLTGGFIDNAKLIAYFDTSDYSYYTGTELYSGDNILI